MVETHKEESTNKKSSPLLLKKLAPIVVNTTKRAEQTDSEFSTLDIEDKIKWLNSKIAKTEAGLNDLVQDAAIDRAMNNLLSWKQQLKVLTGGEGFVDDDDDDNMDVFEIITLNAKQVATKRSNALIVTGQAGVGKTMTVIQAIAFLNPYSITEAVIKDITEDLKEEEEEQEPTEIKVEPTPASTFGTPAFRLFNTPDSAVIKIKSEANVVPSPILKSAPLSKIPGTKKPKSVTVKPVGSQSRNNVESGYYIASGTCTCAALYELLFIHRKKLLVFDDFDTILRDDDCVNLLKAALDTYPIRELSKMTRGKTFNSYGMSDAEMDEMYNETGDLPNQFKFSGTIIFVSNIHEEKFDKALISRSLHVEVRLSREQIIERMYKLMPDIRPNVSMEFKMEALNHLEFILNKYGASKCKFDLNLRELIHAIDYRSEYPTETILLANGKTVIVWQQLLKKRLLKSKIRH